jgi:hypothetical protein
MLSRISKIATCLLLVSLGSIAHAGVFGPSNYYECILAKMPGSKNRIYTGSVIRQCHAAFDDPYDLVPVRKKNWLFVLPTAADCVAKYGNTTTDDIAAQVIYYACQRVYN